VYIIISIVTAIPNNAGRTKQKRKIPLHFYETPLREHTSATSESKVTPLSNHSIKSRARRNMRAICTQRPHGCIICTDRMVGAVLIQNQSQHPSKLLKGCPSQIFCLCTFITALLSTVSNRFDVGRLNPQTYNFRN